MTDHHQQHHGHAPESGEAGMAEVLDLDAEVLASYYSELTDLVRERAGDAPVRRIIDLGSGTGTGTFALLARFPDATATALDSSAGMLAHLRGRAGERGLDGRIETVQADLDTGLPDSEPADLVWASASLHHLADPARLLADVFGALRPGGLLVAAEMDSFPRFLPADLGFGRPGLEARCHEIVDALRAEHLPEFGADWAKLIRGAGFAIEVERTFRIELTAPLPPAAARYAEVALRRLRESAGDRLADDDRAALDALLGGEHPGAVQRRTDLSVRNTRQLWIARRR